MKRCVATTMATEQQLVTPHYITDLCGLAEPLLPDSPDHSFSRANRTTCKEESLVEKR